MPARRRALVAALVAVAALMGSMTATAQDAGDLAAARARVEEISRELRAARSEQRSADAALAEAQSRLDQIEAVVNDMSVQLEQQEADVAQARDDLERLAAQADAVQSAFDRRAVSMFKTSGAFDIEVLLSSADVDSALSRRSYLQVLATADRATLEQVAATRRLVAIQRGALEAEIERLTSMKQEQEQILAQVRELRNSRALVAASARADAVELAHEKEDLQADQRRIERLIRERQSPTPISVAPGGYAWPLCGNVTSEYGRRWGRMHQGIDIDDNLTSAILAAKAGTVIFTGWSGGYGNLTLIDHHDGVVTAYAHQSAFAVSESQQVARGQRIGTVGTTGNSTGTHLHFETRVNGSAVNPRNYLPPSC